MRNLYPVIAIFAISFGLNCNLYAQNRTIDVIYLNNGSIIRGMVIETIPDSLVKIQTADGSLFVFEMSEVTRITKEIKVDRNKPNFQKSICKKGLIYSWVFTVIGSGAMGDAFFATTVIPIIGPIVTIIRIENDPDSYYLSGGKELLTLSAILQTSFTLCYLWSVADDSEEGGLSLYPTTDVFGLKISYKY